ncbi:TM2 domain containing protein [Vibrio phage vB_VpS_BA3]|nr:hypothetical protein VspDsh1_31 [Vibrio phage VspDsh_1]QEQ95107.1 TM2 domain containing protein [Vibrio phage vB_VpS_BA3]
MTTPYINTTIAQANAKSSGACIFLYLFFGLVGAHRYYIKGVTVFNILYTLTIGFLGIMFFIDFFLVWGMANRANTKNLTSAFIKDYAMREGARNGNGN